MQIQTQHIQLELMIYYRIESLVEFAASIYRKVVMIYYRIERSFSMPIPLSQLSDDLL